MTEPNGEPAEAAEASRDPVLMRYRIWLTTIWWGGGALLVIMIVWLMAAGTAFAANEDPVGWLLPHIVPTMGLTGAAAFFAGPGKTSGVDPRSLRFLFLLASAASLFYLLLLFAFILMSLAAPESATPMERLVGWNATLGVIQGVAASAIGVFFAKN